MYETCMSKKDDFWVTALDNSPAPCSITQEALMGNHLAEGSTSRPRTPLEHQIAEKSNSYCTCSARLEMKTTKFVTGSRWQGPKRQISFIVSFFFSFFLLFSFFLFTLKALRVFVTASRSCCAFSLSRSISDRPSKLNQWMNERFLAGGKKKRRAKITTRQQRPCSAEEEWQVI